MERSDSVSRGRQRIFRRAADNRKRTDSGGQDRRLFVLRESGRDGCDRRGGQEAAPVHIRRRPGVVPAGSSRDRPGRAGGCVLRRLLPQARPAFVIQSPRERSLQGGNFRRDLQEPRGLRLQNVDFRRAVRRVRFPARRALRNRCGVRDRRPEPPVRKNENFRA